MEYYMRYYEDIELGDSWHNGAHRVSKEEIIGFARQWDPQPFHIDEQAARDSVFGVLTASSVHTYAISSLIASRSENEIAAVAMLGMEVSFPNPVRVEDDITLETECIEKRASRSRPEVGVMKTRARMLRGDGEIVMKMDATFLVARRPEPAPATPV
jgi:acyl dehydratase